jgi:transcriptional regulator with XRE-family HTH domain
VTRLRQVIGAALRRHRQAQARTLREVADAAGVSLTYLSEIERGRKEASSEVLEAICAALDLVLSELLFEVAETLARLEGAPHRPGPGRDRPGAEPLRAGRPRRASGTGRQRPGLPGVRRPPLRLTTRRRPGTPGDRPRRACAIIRGGPGAPGDARPIGGRREARRERRLLGARA